MLIQKMGRKDGRYSSLEEFRRESLIELVQTDTSCLEVGPYTRPTFSASECRLKTLDFYDTQELRSHAVKIGVDPATVINVDYVCKDENYCEVVKERFDVVIASHVAEHVVAFIKYFQSLRCLLNDGGYLLIVLPDKRYGFDKFRSDTNLSLLIFEYLNPEMPWRGLHSLETAMYYDKRYIKQENVVKDRLNISILEKAASEWHPGDHSHVFQYEDSVPKIFAPLCAMGLIDFDIVDSRMCTQFGEFTVLLKAGNRNTDYKSIDGFYTPSRDTIVNER